MSEEQKKSNLAQIEEKILAGWKQDGTFEQSRKQREGGKTFSFYDGPPFANGLPHFGHTLVTSIKDSLGRYKTMHGYYVERRNGWDCHGLPVEFGIEKQFGVSGKKQILELGLDKFNQACRDSVFTYKKDWEEFFGRVGRWADTANAYATIDRDYTESVWWTLKQVHDKGLLYKGYKSMPYCPRCETPLSNFEVNEGYRDDVPDPSLFVKFKLVDEDASILAWTTTPWSLPGNAAVALNPKEKYSYVELTNDEGQKETLILASKRPEVLDQEYKVVKEVSAQDLIGKKYQPLFKLNDIDKKEGAENLYQVWPAEFVSVEDGTGVLHVAPAFGEDDLSLGLANKLPVLSTVDSGGHIIGGIGFDEVEGKFFKGADKPIIEHLTKQGNVFAAETANHTYPFCYRCDTPLLYYAISTWFIRVSEIKDQLLKTAEDINWSPSHIKDGRFGKWLEGARDWAISRNRYWGAPMPVWVNEQDANDYIVVDSIETLKQLAGDDIKVDDLHRPFIDEITFQKDGKTYRRIEEVLDCWFESGSMPIAQQHYPFENKDRFNESFPADYIGEGLDQTRLWFYVQHVISTIVFDRPAYKNVLVNGMIMAADGQKLSKRLKNYPPVDEVFSDEGADSLRLYLLSNNQAVSADYMRFNRDALKDLNRNVLGTLMNSLRFYKMYADIDGWKPAYPNVKPDSSNVLDKWIMTRLNQTITETTKQADDYKLAHAINPIFELIDDMSNWFIRRSRRRFWKAEDDNDKEQAYATLWFVLTRTAQLLAPWAPFISEYVWQELTDGLDVPKSVHLTDWPQAGKINDSLIREMNILRDAIADGLKRRAEAGIKVRQPLAKATIWNTINSTAPVELNDALLAIAADELNVKEVSYDADGGRGVMPKSLTLSGHSVELDLNITDELKAEGLMRDIVRVIQNARKNADLQVDDRIELSLKSDNSEITKAIEMFKQEIFHETLATKELEGEGNHTETAKVEDQELTISISKA